MNVGAIKDFKSHIRHVHVNLGMWIFKYHKNCLSWIAQVFYDFSFCYSVCDLENYEWLH